MKFKITGANHEEGFVDVEYDDKSWARIHTQAGISEPEFMMLVQAYAPAKIKNAVPDFVEIGFVGDVSEQTPQKSSQPIKEPDWLLNRRAAYGSIEGQIEFIAENGLDLWQEEVRQIKKMFPKE